MIDLAHFEPIEGLPEEPINQHIIANKTLTRHNEEAMRLQEKLEREVTRYAEDISALTFENEEKLAQITRLKNLHYEANKSAYNLRSELDEALSIIDDFKRGNRDEELITTINEMRIAIHNLLLILFDPSNEIFSYLVLSSPKIAADYIKTFIDNDVFKYIYKGLNLDKILQRFRTMEYQLRNEVSTPINILSAYGKYYSTHKDIYSNIENYQRAENEGAGLIGAALSKVTENMIKKLITNIQKDINVTKKQKSEEYLINVINQYVEDLVNSSKLTVQLGRQEIPSDKNIPATPAVIEYVPPKPTITLHAPQIPIETPHIQIQEIPKSMIPETPIISDILLPPPPPPPPTPLPSVNLSSEAIEYRQDQPLVIKPVKYTKEEREKMLEEKRLSKMSIRERLNEEINKKVTLRRKGVAGEKEEENIGEKEGEGLRRRIKRVRFGKSARKGKK